MIASALLVGNSILLLKEDSMRGCEVWASEKKPLTMQKPGRGTIRGLLAEFSD